MKRGKIFLLLLVVFFNAFILEARADRASYKKVFDLVNEDDDLGSQIIQRLNFNVSDNQFLRKGDTLKFLLKGSDAGLYLFKTYLKYDDANVPNSFFGMKFSILCDIPAPDCYPIWLPMNNQLVYGSVQGIIDGITRLEDSQAPLDKNWLKYYLFRWLLGDPTPDIYLLPDNMLVNIDYDRAKDTAGIAFKDFDYGRFSRLLRISLKSGKFEQPFQEAVSFIDYAQDLPEAQIRGLFGPYAFDEKINNFDLRRDKLKNEFLKYCRQIAREEGVKFTFDASGGDKKAYARRVLVSLQQRIDEKKKILAGLFSKPVLRSNLVIISSQSAAPSLNYKDAPINKLNLLINNRIETLKALRKETGDISERIAISLYLNRYRQFLPYLNCGILPLEDIQFIFSVPEISIKTVEANLRVGSIINGNEILLFLPDNYTNSSLQEYYEEHIRDNPGQQGNNSEWGQIMAGNCYLYKFELKKAMAEYQKVIGRESSSPKAKFLAHLILGYIYELGRDYIRFGEGWQQEKAREEFIEAIKIMPNSGLARLNLNVINWCKDGSEISSGTASSLDGEGHFVLGMVYLVKKKYDLAGKHINSAGASGYDKELINSALEELERMRNLKEE